MPPKVYSITLAAGVGSRMPLDMRPKACCRVGPTSVIENALKTYEQAGIERHLIVVGRGAEKVMEEVTRTRRDVLFAYQREPRGTGDAVRCGLELLASAGAPAQVMISAGDKVIAPHLIRGLLETYTATEADFCLVAGRSDDHAGSGRIIERKGRAAGIIEVPDIKIRQLAERIRNLAETERPRTVGDLVKLASNYVKDLKKLTAQFPALGEILAARPEQPLVWEQALQAAQTVPEGFTLATGPISLKEASQALWCNLSVYAGAFDVVREAVARLRSDNVQGEWYFTDVVEILAAAGREVALFRTTAPEDIMDFNTVEQLEAIRKVCARSEFGAPRHPKLAAWNQYAARRSSDALMAEAVRGLSAQIGPERTGIVVRSPGRVNLMGRHIDHQGGMCNLMAIDREIVMAVSPREDDRINVWNAESANYPYRAFSFAELTVDIVWEDWLRTLNTQFVQRAASKDAGDWVNYMKGAALRLQHRFRDRKLRGMDAFVTGNIPTAAGLSSSSALVVAMAEALTSLNALNVGIKEFVDLCGEGEWFVGTRGGAADHAAIKYGREKEVVSVSFYPFEVVANHPFPDGCCLMVCHSGISAKKTENARERFNARVACYHMAREVIKERFPQFAPLVEHLRDVNTRRLDISLPALYSLLKQLPATVETPEAERLAAAYPTVAKCVSGFKVADMKFPLRAVALYGLAEMERAQNTGDLLQRGDVTALGALMKLSHDGDRVARWTPDCKPFLSPADDARMNWLIEQSQSLRPFAETGAALWQQPGAYACSTPEIDLLVDSALRNPGVLGAQIAGAGLGGCVMVLVRQDAADAVRTALERDYYSRQGIEPRIFLCRPSRGSQVLTTVEADCA